MAKSATLGAHRRKARGTYDARRPRLAVPAELLRTAGEYRLPATPATAKQERALRELMAAHLRRGLVSRYPDLSPNLLAECLGVSEPTARGLLKGPLIADELRAQAALTADVLRAMARGQVAGPLGTRRTNDTERLFAWMRYADLRGARGEASTPDLDVLHAAFRIDMLSWIGQ